MAHPSTSQSGDYLFPEIGEILMRSWKVLVLALFATITVMPLSFAEDGKAIKKAMKEAMKGGLNKKVAEGNGSDDDKKALLALYVDMAKDAPPKGDAASWKEKTSALVQASQDMIAGKEGAAGNLKKAANCKACHSVHKGK
jgi:surface antigen